MSSFQINFKSTISEWQLIADYLVQNEIKGISAKSNSEIFTPITLHNPITGFYRLLLSSDALLTFKRIVPKTGDAFFFADVQESEVLELNLVRTPQNSNELSGRLYYITGYWKEDVWYEKNTGFCTQAELFFRWFKKQHITRKRTTPVAAYGKAIAEKIG